MSRWRRDDGDIADDHDGAESSTATAREDYSEPHTFSLSRRATYDNSTDHLETFPSFPQQTRTNGQSQRSQYQTAPSGPDSQRRETFLSTRPSIWPGATFDLGDEGTPVYARDPNGTYVDPEYAMYNSPAAWPDNTPVWGLSKPLPRIVRASVRKSKPRRKGSEDEMEKKWVAGEEKGDVEAAPWAANLSDAEERPGPSSMDRYRTAESQRRQSRERRRTHQASTTSRPRRSTSTGRESLRLEPLGSHARRLRMSTRTREDGRHEEVDIPATVPESQEAEIPAPEDQDHQVDGADKQERTEEQRPDEEVKPDFLNKWAYVRHKLRQPFAEYLATAIGFTIGFCGNFAQTVVPSTSSLATSSLTGPMSWGFGIMMAVYVGGGISGAHLNPAISLMLSIFRGFPASKCLQYFIAQFLGALTAAGISFALYSDAIYHLDNGRLLPNTTGIGFYTQPKDWVSPPTAFFNELVGSAVLGSSILALGDDTNAPPGAGMSAFIIGLLVFVLSVAFSPNTSACLNPVRDFAPRLVASMAGYGHEVWTSSYYYWIWGPWLADPTGIMIGAFVYDALIFVGGESPVNYPVVKRRQVEAKSKARWWKVLNRRSAKVKKWEKEADDLGNELQQGHNH